MYLSIYLCLHALVTVRQLHRCQPLHLTASTRRSSLPSNCLPRFGRLSFTKLLTKQSKTTRKQSSDVSVTAAAVFELSSALREMSPQRAVSRYRRGSVGRTTSSLFMRPSLSRRILTASLIHRVVLSDLVDEFTQQYLQDMLFQVFLSYGCLIRTSTK